MLNTACAHSPEQYYIHMHAGIAWSTGEVRGHTVHMGDITTEEALQAHPHIGHQWVL